MLAGTSTAGDGRAVGLDAACANVAPKHAASATAKCEMRCNMIDLLGCCGLMMDPHAHFVRCPQGARFAPWSGPAAQMTALTPLSRPGAGKPFRRPLTGERTLNRCHDC